MFTKLYDANCITRPQCVDTHDEYPYVMAFHVVTLLNEWVWWICLRFFISTFVNYFLLPLQWLHQSIITTQDTDNSTLFNSLFGVMTRNDTFDWPLWVESIGGFHSQITSIASPYQKFIGFSEILKIILRIFYLSVIKLYNKTCISGDTKSPINLKELYVCIHTYSHACYTTICTTMYL